MVIPAETGKDGKVKAASEHRQRSKMSCNYFKLAAASTRD